MKSFEHFIRLVQDMYGQAGETSYAELKARVAPAGETRQSYNDRRNIAHAQYGYENPIQGTTMQPAVALGKMGLSQLVNPPSTPGMGLFNSLPMNAGLQALGIGGETMYDLAARGAGEVPSNNMQMLSGSDPSVAQIMAGPIGAMKRMFGQ